ncbi:MAG: hypothetical protein L6Q52_07625 [Rhodocyclaceae bacterium]|nr:hypothetical protein [Rhodocyclaceae bacterium]
MKIEIKKVTLVDFTNAVEGDGVLSSDELASAAVMADLVVEGQEINDVPVHIGGNHIYGGCSQSEAKLVVWLDDADGGDPHKALEARLDEVDPVDGKTNVEEALEADPRIAQIKERVWQKWEKV